eukprot:GHVR01095561.1.p1 GENE.GHVR01095561.1~~GHVR01095561.1.p1  ORF type:complete len:151 (+),score=11.92 GHVR01095561.1:113-565(+)
MAQSTMSEKPIASSIPSIPVDMAIVVCVYVYLYVFLHVLWNLCYCFVCICICVFLCVCVCVKTLPCGDKTYVSLNDAVAMIESLNEKASEADLRVQKETFLLRSELVRKDLESKKQVDTVVSELDMFVCLRVCRHMFVCLSVCMFMFFFF